MSTLKKEINDLYQSELYLYFYGNALSGEKTKRECDFIVEHCAIKNNANILDLACGHGRHSIYFATNNHKVCGIDMNKDFIDLAQKNAEEKGLTVKLIEGDILTIDYEEVFDVVLLLYNTLGFFDRNDCFKIFENISRALKKGGKAFIDCKNRDHIIKEIKPYEVHEKGDDLMIDRLSFNPINGTTTNNRIYLKDGKRYDTPFTMYCYNYSDIENLLKNSDLKIQKVLGGWKGETFDSESRRIILIVEKL